MTGRQDDRLKNYVFLHIPRDFTIITEMSIDYNTQTKRKHPCNKEYSTARSSKLVRKI